MSLDNSSASVYAAVTNKAVFEGVSQSSTGSVFFPKTPETFTYDLDGNMTSDGRWTNRWDAENRLISMEALASVPSAARKKLTFTYDNQSRRISKTVSNWTGSAWSFGYQRKFVYDDWNLVAELDGNNNWVRSYLWGTDLSGRGQGAGGVGGLLAIKDAQEGTHFACYDGNGNITGLVKGTDGTTSTRYEYDPFGRTIRATGTLATRNPYRFSTKYTDDESGWLYYGYRFYDPERGRWPSRDPIGERGGPNRYEFVRNCAIDSVDALGLITMRNGFWTGAQVWEKPISLPAGHSETGTGCCGRIGTVYLQYVWVDATTDASLPQTYPAVWSWLNNNFRFSEYFDTIFQDKGYVGGGIALFFLPNQNGTLCCKKITWKAEKKGRLFGWNDDGTFTGTTFVDSPGELRQNIATSYSRRFRVTLKCNNTEVATYYWSISIDPSIVEVTLTPPP